MSIMALTMEPSPQSNTIQRPWKPQRPRGEDLEVGTDSATLSLLERFGWGQEERMSPWVISHYTYLPQTKSLILERGPSALIITQGGAVGFAFSQDEFQVFIPGVFSQTDLWSGAKGSQQIISLERNCKQSTINTIADVSFLLGTSGHPRNHKP